MRPGLGQGMPSSPARLPPPGWYSDPAGPGLLRWWDGEAWTAWTLSAWAPPARPPRPPSRLAWWLATPAGSAAAAGLAVIAAVGWVVAAVVFGLAMATGTWAGTLAAWLHAAAFPVLPAADSVAALAALVIRGWYGPGGQGGASRAARRARTRAARAARESVGRISSYRFVLRRAAARLSGARLLRSLPRPVGPAVAATVWVSLLAFGVSEAWSATEMMRPVPIDQTPAGQLGAVALWMVHLAIWCGMACRQLNRNRVAAGMWVPWSAGGVSRKSDR